MRQPYQIQRSKGLASDNQCKACVTVFWLANYYIRNIKSFAHIVAPLTNLLVKGKVWRWGPAQQESFDHLKMALTTIPALTLPNPEQPYYMIETNVSDIVVGAVFM